MPSVLPQCWACRHYFRALNCYAYVHGIPRELWFGEHARRASYEGDSGMRFEPRDD